MVVEYPEEVLIEKGWTKYISISISNSGDSDINNVNVFIEGVFPDWFEFQNSRADIIQVEEKIEFATIPINPNKTIQKSTNNIIIQEEYITEENGISFNDRAQKMHGVIKNESEKALLISFNNGSEVWIPKSKIHSKFESTKDLVQVFLIEDWILKKNNIIN